MFALRFLSILLLSLFIALPTFAARVVAVKGRKVLIDMEGDNLRKGEIYYLISKRGRKKGLVKIYKIKGSKALAKMSKKSKAKKSWTLRKKRGKRRHKTARKSSLKHSTYWGFMAGFSMTTMDVKNINNLNSTSMSGSGFSAKGIFDYALFERLWFRGLLGIEQFNASSDDSFCTGDEGVSFTAACKTEIMYVSGDVWGRYLLSLGKYRPWVGASFNLLFPMSKDSTAVNKSSISSTSVISLGGGLDWQFSKKFSIPIQVEYGLFPSSSTAEANMIAFRAGILMPF